MESDRARLLAALTLALAAVVLTVSAGSGFAREEGPAKAKPHCKTVVKKVHGKKKHVRVCSKRKPKPKPAPPETVVAKKLVSRVLAAKTPAARYQAMLALMKALNLGVMSARGSAVVPSPEPNAARLAALYDFEVRGLVEQVARGQTTTLDDLSATLMKGGLGLDDTRSLPAALVAEALHDATQQALSKPRSGASLLPLVVRELGLRRGYDTARTTDPAQLKLDSLQAWLITVDLTLPVLREVPLAGARATASETDLPGECLKFRDASEELQNKIEKALGGKIQKWIADHAAGSIYDKIAGKLKREGTRWAIRNMPRWAVREIYDAVKGVEAAVPLIDLIHGSLLAYSIDVSSDASLPPIHWWHSASERTTLTFKVKVTMLDDYGDYNVKCGALLGFELPPKGGIKDVSVVWTQAQNDIRPQGKLDCGTGCITKTGVDGVAKLVFTPNIEPLPGIGVEREDTGVIDGVALYQSAAGGGVTGGIAQFLTPKFGSTRWFVRSHRPRGVKFATPHEYPPAPTTEGANLGYAVDARVCGSNPFAAPWSGTRHTLVRGAGAPFPDKHDTFSDLAILGWEQQASSSRFPLYWDDGKPRVGGFDVELMAGPPAQARVRIVDDYPFDGGTVIHTYTVPLEEDLSCPPLP